MNKVSWVAVGVLVVAIGVCSYAIPSMGGRPVPANVRETDQQASYKKTIDFLLSTEVFRAVDLQTGIVWVDDAFLEKTHHNQENAIWPVFLHLVGRGESEWFATVEIRHVDTDKKIGKFARGSLTL